MSLKENKPADQLGNESATGIESDGTTRTENTAEMKSDLVSSGGGVVPHLRLVKNNTARETRHGIGEFYNHPLRPVALPDKPIIVPNRPPVHTYPKTVTGLGESEALAMGQMTEETRDEYKKALEEVKKTGEEQIEASRPSLRNAGVPKDLMFQIEDEATNEIVDEPTLPGVFFPKAPVSLKSAPDLLTEVEQIMIENGERILIPGRLPETREKLPTLSFEEIDSELNERPTVPGIKHAQIIPGPLARPKVEEVPAKKTSGWKKFRNWMGAAALGVMAIFGAKQVAEDMSENEMPAPMASSSVRNAAPVESLAPVMPSVKEQVAPMPIVKNQIVHTPKVDKPVKAVETVPARTLHAAKILKMSENKVLKSTLENGEFIVQPDSSLLDSMLMPYVGMASPEQKVQIKQLERDVQLGLTMYMYDRFGTPEKLEVSLKDPALRNLYKTVKTWNLSNVERRLPAADVVRMKELARRIVEDARGLGHDKAERAERAAVIDGNFFNARGIGDVVKMRFADGRKHVLLEKMDEIFHGGISHIMDKKAPAAIVKTPATAPAQVQDQFFQNMMDLEAIDAGWDDVVETKPKTQAEELQEIDAGWDDVTDNKAEKIVVEKLTEERTEFEKSGIVKFELPRGLTTREENNLLLQELLKKVQELMPDADAKVVERVMKQFEFRAVRRQVKNGRNVEMELSSRFREILRYELNKGKIGV
ncbi:MAG: hypothetical protein ACRCZE_00325 [Candidatus Altimarinota bacterium]